MATLAIITLLGGSLINTFTAKEAKNKFGQLLDSAQRAPVTITKNGRAVAMMLSLADEKMISAIEDLLEAQYWDDRIAEAEQGGYLSVEESNQVLEDALNARD